MKLVKILLFSLSIILSGNINAQISLQDGMEWYYSMVKFIGYKNYSNRHYIQGDTIIQNKNCKILYKEDATCDNRPEVEYLWEDQSKVYYYNFEEEAFKLLYDYAAEVGDTIRIDAWEGSSVLNYEDFFSIIIDDIEIVQFGGQSLKQFSIRYLTEAGSNFEFPYGAQEGTKIIEGVGVLGNYFYIIGNGWCDWQYNIDLRCVYHPELDTLKFGELECDSTYLLMSTTMSPELARKVDVYPNPTSGQLNIAPSDEIMLNEITLFNTLGEKVGRYEPGLGITAIEVGNYTAGIYYLLLRDAAGMIFSKKIFIH